MIYTFNVIPNTKPRMTRSDKWKKRPCVVQYHQFKDDLRKELKKFPEFKFTGNFEVEFGIPIKNKKNKEGTPHLQSPDIDNLFKGFTDAILEQDNFIWKVSASKIWSKEGYIKIKFND